MKKVKQIKKALPLLLMMVLFVTSVLPAYAAGTVSYEYNWEGQEEVAYSDDITVDVGDSTVNTVTIKSETLDEGTNNFVRLYYGEDADASLKVNVSEVDPTKDMVFSMSLRRPIKSTEESANTMPKLKVVLHGKDENGNEVNQQLLDIFSNNIKYVGEVNKNLSGYFGAIGAWTDFNLTLKPGEDTNALILNVCDDVDNGTYEVTYEKNFKSLTEIEICVYGGSSYFERCFYVDNIKAQNVADSVADNAASIDGVGYATLEAAVNAAEANDIIKLEADATLPSGYDKEVTYDLNGHTLTADAFTGINATVVDSSNGNNGLLKIPHDKLVFDINNDNDGYIPVWDNESNGYRFSSVTISDIEYDSSDALVFAMRPAFDSPNIEKLVAEGYKTGRVRVGVRITWPGSDKPFDLPLSDDWLLTMYGGEIAKGVKLTISGGETITEFTATTIVWSEQCPYVVITGEETHTYPATVAE